MTIDMFGNIPRVCTAIADWVACLIFLQHMKPRFSSRIHVLLSILFLPVMTAYMQLTDGFDGTAFNLFMLGSAIIMFLFMKLMSTSNLASIFFYCSRSFLLAGFVASFFWQMYSFGASLHDSIRNLPMMLGIMLINYVFLFGLFYMIDRDDNDEPSHVRIKPMESAVNVFTAYFIYVLSSISYSGIESPFGGSSQADRYNIRTFVYLAGVAIQTAYYAQQREFYAETQSMAMRNMLKMQYNNYQIGKESIEVVNQKYHDLKHQIAVLRAQSDPDKRNAYLDKMEEEIRTYEAQNKTGNQVLDIVLTTKALICQKENIQMSVVADGKLLNMMDEIDISTIFGNAIDNAIESVRKIEDTDKRLITVKVSSQNGFLHIIIGNCYEGEIKMVGGLPKTTKKNKEYHGFGVKGIKQTVLKYDGSTKIKAENGWFELRILIP
jgi:hypothetical protein